MARKGNSRAAHGSGTIRKKTVTRSGKVYTYWEARITTGRDPGTGKQIQRSFSGKTQKEVLEKMQAATAALNTGTYTAPYRLTVGEWLTIWERDYLGGVKVNTARSYKTAIKCHIKPALGAVRLQNLHPHTVQGFINGLSGYAPQTIHNIHKTLHRALEKAVDLAYITQNPASKCVLPPKKQQEVCPLDDQQVSALLQAAKGGPLGILITVALFTGLRLSELLGLTWDSINFDVGYITVSKQLAPKFAGEGVVFQSPKNGKSRTIAAAAFVLSALKRQRVQQAEMRLIAGPLWDNAPDLVFTREDGGPLRQRRVDFLFHALVESVGLEGFHFHDLRHTYAVNAIRAGDDIKTVQGNLGHSSAAFTLNKYGHFTERMKQDSAARMDGFIKGVLSL